MAAPTLAPMPDNLDLDAGYTLRVTALDATTGALVAGVNVGQVVLTVAEGVIVTDSGGAQVGPYMLVPGPGA